MKKIAALALTMLSTSVLATTTISGLDTISGLQESPKQGLHVQAGLGILNTAEYIGGEYNQNVAVPLINVSYNDRFYFKFNKLGGWIYKSDNGFRIGALLTQQSGIDKDDTSMYVYNREETTMVGINAEYKTGMFSSEIGFLQGTGDGNDYNDGSDGGKLYAQAHYTVLARPNYSLTVSAKVERWDADLVGYYYDNGRSTTNVSLALVGTYKLTDEWTLLGAVSGTSLGDGIGNSGMVQDDRYNTVLVGATYSF
jgi:outer membrane scaffolding protein for murein synthesis (MipA/OmpV family)